MTEITERRKATNTLINRDPQSVAVLRNTSNSDGAGGASQTSSAVGAQTFRLASLPRGGHILTETGEAVTSGGMLLGVYNADIKAGDFVTVEGSVYEVISVRIYDHKTEADMALR